jgi:hypothetical protein
LDENVSVEERVLKATKTEEKTLNHKKDPEHVF